MRRLVFRKNFTKLYKDKLGKFFFKNKRNSTYFINNNKLSPHKKRANITINFNYTRTHLKTASIHFSIVNFYINYWTGKFYTSFITGLGEIFLKPYTLGMKFFQLTPTPCYSFFFIANFFQKIVGFKISNLNHGCTKLLATSPGTYISVIGRQRNGHLKLVLPSNKQLITKTGFFLLGINVFSRYFFKKNFYLRNKSINLGVRGIAKNPVDHPNGGNSNTKGSFKTPWGYNAKNNK